MAGEAWVPTTGPMARLPERGQCIDWIGPMGEQVNGGDFFQGVWFLPSGEIYAYYTPTFWRPTQAEGKS